MGRLSGGRVAQDQTFDGAGMVIDDSISWLR